MVTPLLPICNRPGSSLQVFVSTTLTSSIRVGIADILTDQASVTTTIARGCLCLRLLQFLFRYLQRKSNLTKLPSLHQSTRASTRPRTTHWTWSLVKFFPQIIKVHQLQGFGNWQRHTFLSFLSFFGGEGAAFDQ